MARTTEQIQQEIIDFKNGNTELSELNSISKSAIWLLITYVVAYAIFTLEKLFDLHTDEVDKKIQLLKPHSKTWYRGKALSFQWGHAVVTDTDYYDNAEVDPQLVADSKIVKYSAVDEAQDDSRIIIKIATEINGKLQPITNAQRESFEAYIATIKDAGVRTTVINFLPDLLYMSIRIFRDPLVLDSSGTSIISGTKPVEDAIKAYLKNLPFNGELILPDLAVKLRDVPGVVIAQIDVALSSWINAETNAYGDPEGIDVRKIPVSGYYEMMDFNNLSYVV